MATYVEIDDTEIDPESPVTASLVTRLRDNALAYFGAPSGTKTLVRQDASPLGWTIDGTYNDRALRLTNSSSVSQGGSVGFSSLFGRIESDAFTLTQAQLPTGVTLSVSISDTRTWGVTDIGGSPVGIANINRYDGSLGTTPALSTTGIAVTPGVTVTGGGISGTAPLGGSSAAIKAPMDMRLAYIDVKLVTKD